MWVWEFKNTLTMLPDTNAGWGGQIIGANNGQTRIKTIFLPDTITYIGNDCFWGNPNLEYINLEELTNLDGIMHGSFGQCGFKNIVLGENIKTIGSDSFVQNDKMLSFDISNTKINELPNTILTNNSNDLHYILLPSTIETCDDSAFGGHWSNSRLYTRTHYLKTPILTFNTNLTVLQTLVINNFNNVIDGVETFASGEVQFYVPDEFYQGYLDKYSSFENLCDRIHPYSDGIPEPSTE